MARENHVRLRGVLPADPIIRESNDGKDAYAVFNVFVSRPNRVVGDKQGGIKKVNILVSSRNPGIVRVAKTLKKFDAVDINGVLTTKLIKKSSFCTYCGHKNMTMGTMVYVTPNYIEYISKVEDIKDALRYISDRAEISNTLRVIGEVMTEPKILHKTTGTPVDFTQYKLKLRRKMKIKEDDPKIGSDFPWVKSYGENAILDRFRLNKGSTVYIDGCVQTRYIKRHIICGQKRDHNGQYMTTSTGEPIIEVDPNTNKELGCGTVYDWNDQVLEIVPFAVEYLTDYIDKNDNKEIIEQRLDMLRGVATDMGNLQQLDDNVTEEELQAGLDRFDQGDVEFDGDDSDFS